MKLPNARLAVVAKEKVRDYLLNAAHPDNGGKAPFFTALGFSQNHWQHLAVALATLAQTADISKNMDSPHGSKYILDGRIVSPSGKIVFVRTVWIVDCGGEQPRLVTAYPFSDEATNTNTNT